MTEEPDYYALLDVSPEADEATIRTAFRQLARRYHPDVAGTGNLERMQKLNVAYQTLSDPERRLRYDLAYQGRRGARPSPRPAAATTPTITAAASAQYGLDSGATGPFHRLQTIALSERFPVSALEVARGSQVVAIGALDGRVLLWDMGTRRALRCVSAGAANAAGVLQEVRLSPSGALVMAWGYQLGLHVWSSADGTTLWHASATAPSGMMDAALFDAPPMVRIAIPQAPIALASDDPFRWAHEGRYGTSVLSRPLAGPVAPGWAVPLDCAEMDDNHAGHRSVGGPGVQIRALAENGRRLLACLVQPGKSDRLVRALHVWDLDRRSLRGAAQPKIIVTYQQPMDDLDFPMAFTPDLAWGAATRWGRELVVFSLHDKRRHTVQTGPIPPDARLALSPDGALVALAYDTAIRLWRTDTGQLTQTWRATSEIGPVVFVGRQNALLLAAGLADGLVEVWTT